MEKLKELTGLEKIFTALFFSVLGFLAIMVIDINNDVAILLNNVDRVEEIKTGLKLNDKRLDLIESTRFTNSDFSIGIKVHELEMIQKYELPQKPQM